jgi:hypothetical protein
MRSQTFVCAIVAGIERSFGAGRESLNSLRVWCLVGGYVTGLLRLNFQTSAFCVKFINRRNGFSLVY